MTSPLRWCALSMQPSTYDCSLSWGTTLLTRPQWWAYAAEIGSPQSSISLAFFSELMERMSCTPGVEQNSPHFTPGVLKEEFQVASRMSQVRAIWNPAAAAMPLTAQSVMRGNCLSLSRVSVHSLKMAEGLSDAASSLRSWPAEKAGPSASITSTWVNSVGYFDFRGFGCGLDLPKGRIDFPYGGEGEGVALFGVGEGEHGCLPFGLRAQPYVGVGGPHPAGDSPMHCQQYLEVSDNW